MKHFRERRPCPKCGSSYIQSRYTRLVLGIGEVIRRTCERCGYVWDERTMDSEDAA